MKKVFIEGTSNRDNGCLREAFAKLFKKELNGKMPQIVMGDGKQQTIEKFCTTPLFQNEERYLLIDSDMYPFDKESLLKKFSEQCTKLTVACTLQNTYFMIQEVEAWILSQPEVIKSISIPKYSSTEQILNLSKPSEILSVCYHKKKRTYHKVRDFCQIFPLLNSEQLKKDFSEYQNLIEQLKQ